MSNVPGFKTLESRWEELVKDIETGTINPDLDIPEDVRAEIQAGTSRGIYQVFWGRISSCEEGKGLSWLWERK